MHVDFSAAWDRLQALLNGLVANLPNFTLGLLVFLVFVLLGRLSRRAAGRYTAHHTGVSHAAIAVARLANGTVLVLGLLVAAAIALPTFKPGDLIQVLGIGSVAVGFAFRDILQNFLAGILLLLTHPFHIGDQIVTGGLEGTVEEIQARATFLKTYDNRRVVIPNAELFTNKVTVNTAFPIRRLEYDIAIGNGDDIGLARKLIVEALIATENVLNDPKPEALVMELAPYSVNVRARWWVTPPRMKDVLDARDTALAAIKQKLTENGIDLPYPTNQILFHDQTEETDGDRRRQREGWPAGQGEVPAPWRMVAAGQIAANRDHKGS
jgi:small-conductance mechanosensitive channel